MQLRFTKMQGAGNDFVVLDGTASPVELTTQQVQRLADRRFGVGADQVLMVEKSATPGVDFRYRIYNGFTGDEVEHCGNGARCFVRYVLDKGLTEKTTVRVETVNNVLELHAQPDGRVTVDMNAPLFDPAALPFDAAGLQARDVNGCALWPIEGVEVALVSMGNPHAVQRVPDVDAAPVATLGPRIEGHARFPRRVNAGFMEVMAHDRIRLRVYERGAGETLACGTGACAAVVAGIRLGWLEQTVEVDTRGGRLTIQWGGGDADHVLMTGAAQTVYEGEITL